MPRCAVIANPIKVSPAFRGELDARLTRDGWEDTLWLETSVADPGHAVTAQAVAAQVDLVIGAGGDGTIRVMAGGLAGAGIPMGLIPAGTANLLARNLGIPLSEVAAIEVALTGDTRTIDLIQLRVDGGEPEHFAVMAGMGVDAMIMDQTSPQLKAHIGPAAYVLAAAKAVGRLPMKLDITVDGGRRHRRRKAMICVIGNVGELPGKIALIPDARPDDGQLDVYVASPHRFTHWVRVIFRLLSHRQHEEEQIDLWRGTRVVVELEKSDAYELDGDVEGRGRRLEAEIVPGALLVRVPASG